MLSFPRASFLALTLATFAAAGCAAETDAEEATSSEEALRAREGYARLPALDGAVYVSVAVSGRTAFVGDNDRTLRAWDLGTSRVTKTVADRTRPVDHLAASGGTLAACGERDDQPDGWAAVYGQSDRHYVVTLLDARTLVKKREIALRLQPYLETAASSGFIDLPSMSCGLDEAAGTVTVSFAHGKLADEVVTFPIPAADTKVDFRAIPGATRTKLSDARDRDTTVKAVASSPNGITFAAGGWGVRRLAPGARAYTTLRAQPREHIVDVAVRKGVLFAADHQGALLALDDATGRELGKVAVGDWLEGVALADGYVVVVGRQGLQVVKDVWSTR